MPTRVTWQIDKSFMPISYNDVVTLEDLVYFKTFKPYITYQNQYRRQPRELRDAEGKSEIIIAKKCRIYSLSFKDERREHLLKLNEIVKINLCGGYVVDEH